MGKFVSQNALNTAVLFKLFELAQTKIGDASVADLSKSFSILIGTRRLALALEYLDAGRLVVQNMVNGNYAISQKGYAEVETALKNEDSQTYHYWAEGDDWLISQTLGGYLIPASDRVVALDHNRPETLEISESLKNIEAAIMGANEAFPEAEDRQVALAEISALRRVWEASSVRLDRFRLRANNALTWIAKQASSAAISEICKNVIKLIFSWS